MLSASMGSAGVYTFEDIDGTLPYIPLAARRVLDGLGRKLSLEAWLSLDVEARRRIVAAGAGERVDGGVLPLVDGARPAPHRVPPEADPDDAAPPSALAMKLGPSRPLAAPVWHSLTALDRYALGKYAGKPVKLAQAYDEILGPSPSGSASVPSTDDEKVEPTLTHLTAAGEAHMVDVGAKGETARRAVASARVRTTRAVVLSVAAGTMEKGDVLAVARVAGILASKRTPELVPLCHPVRTTHASVELELDAAASEIRVRAVVEAVDRTGVEMEAMTAASVASLTLYDMIKAADRWATIDAVRLEAKSGGKSGEVVRPPERT
jgi:cyclic pyranopterin phosphate synthase